MLFFSFEQLGGIENIEAKPGLCVSIGGKDYKCCFEIKEDNNADAWWFDSAPYTIEYSLKNIRSSDMKKLSLRLKKSEASSYF